MDPLYPAFGQIFNRIKFRDRPTRRRPFRRRRWRFRRRRHRVDALLVEEFPQRLERLKTVVVELRFADPEELPSDPLEVSLAFGVLLVLVRAMPVVAVTFNCESRGGTFYYQVDLSAIDLELWDYAVSKGGTCSSSGTRSDSPVTGSKVCLLLS